MSTNNPVDDELVKSIQNAVDDTAVPVALHRLRLASVGLSNPMRDHEMPVVRSHVINAPLISKSQTAPIDFTSCDGCGYTHKSITDCPRCATLSRLDGEAKPFHQR